MVTMDEQMLLLPPGSSPENSFQKQIYDQMVLDITTYKN